MLGLAQVTEITGMSSKAVIVVVATVTVKVPRELSADRTRAGWRQGSLESPEKICSGFTCFSNKAKVGLGVTDVDIGQGRGSLLVQRRRRLLIYRSGSPGGRVGGWPAPRQGGVVVQSGAVVFCSAVPWSVP